MLRVRVRVIYYLHSIIPKDSLNSELFRGIRIKLLKEISVNLYKKKALPTVHKLTSLGKSSSETIDAK